MAQAAKGRLMPDWKRIPRKFLLERQIEIRRGPRLYDFLRSRSIDLVLDVGANEGQFAKELRRQFYDGQIVSFEPISAVFAELEKAANSDPKWDVRRTALGEQESTATINVSEFSVFSSMLPLAAVANDFDKKSAIVRQETIPVIALDDIFDAFEGRNVFLKIDTQGFESAVLKGAKRSLTKILGVQLELPVENLYETSWLLEEAIAEMRGYGFLPAQFTPVNRLPWDDVSAIEFDCVFRRIKT